MAAEALDRRVGWDRLPLPRRDTGADRPAEPAAREEPLRHRPRPARPARRRRAPAPPDRAHARRHVQRPRRPADGQPRQPLRAQRPARVHGPRAGRQAARAESAPRQPRAAHARRVHPGDDAQPARGRVDPVRGARLVQPRQERAGEPVASSRSRTTTRGREHPMEIARTRPDPSADPSGPPTFVTDDTHWWDGSQIYGRDPAFAARVALGRARQAADRRARPAAARHRGARRPRPASPATSGSGSRCCTRSSCASTTRSATTCTRRIPSCPTTSSTTRRGSSSPR